MANNVLEAQKMLTKLGYAPGPIDGGYGTKTKNALENFYAAQNKKFDGELSENEISALTKASNNPDFSFEALKMMDDHVKQSALLKVPMPSSNLVIKDYRRFRDYRRTNYENNLSFSTDRKKWLWKEIKTSGNILSKEYCYETLAKFLIPTTPDGVNNGRTQQDFTDCQKSFHVFSLTNFDASFKLYEKLFLEMATSEKDHWVYKRSNVKNNNPNFYHLGGVIATFYMYYAVNYEAFNYTKKQRNIIENYFKKKAFAERFNLDGDGKTSLCPIKNPMNFNRRVHFINNCESVRLRFAAGELALAIVTQDRALWKKGLWDLDFTLSMINDEGFFVPLSAKGCKALGYTYSTSKLFSLNVEMLKLAGFNLLNYKSRHEKTISQAYEMLFKQYEDITISNHIAKKSFGAMSCGMKPYKTHNEFLAWEAGFGNPVLNVGLVRVKKAYDPNNNYDPDLSDYISWSIRFVSEEHPEWVKENLLQDIKTDFDSNNYFTINPFEIYNANVMLEPKSIWMDREKIDKELKQAALKASLEAKNEIILKNKSRLKKNAERIRLAKIQAEKNIILENKLRSEKNDKKLKILKQKEEEKKLEAALLNKQMNEIVDVSFEDVFIDIFKREGSYQQIRLDFSKLDLGGKIYDSFWLNLMIDYASKSSKQNLLDLLRIQISADEMVPDNILAELKKCKSIQWKITNEGIRLHYLIGNEAELNPCILKNMYPSKRNFLGSIANALPSIFEIGLAKKPEQLDVIMVLLNDARQ
jgi:hypothetical protein